MTDLQIEFEQSLAGLRVLQDATAAIERILADLDDQARGLAGRWTGEASEAYAVAHASWSVDLRAMNRLLAQAAEALDESRSRYQDTDDAVAALWG
jgi:WXG100 family type VII secretion target